MRKFVPFAVVFALVLAGCSDKDSKPKQTPDVEELIAQSEEATKKGIMVDFMAAITKDDYKKAYDMLSPELSQAWTIKGFNSDFAGLRKQVGKDWAVKPVSSMSWANEYASFKNVGYQVDSDFSSIASVVLTAKKAKGEEKILRVVIKKSYGKKTPAAVKALVEKFVAAMLDNKPDVASEMLSETAKRQLSPQSQKRIATILGKTPEDTEFRGYRMCINSKWVDAVQLTSKNDPATHIIFIMSKTKGGLKIVSFSLKSRF